MISQAKLLEVLDYDPATGLFIWRTRTPNDAGKAAKVATWNARYAGRVAGVKTHGYIVISIDNRKYYAHRLAWLYVHGAVVALLDHINRDGQDNSIANLRPTTKRINNLNSFRKDNTSGFRGVIPSANGKRFVAQGKRPGKRGTYIGTFDTAEEAYAAYLSAQ